MHLTDSVLIGIDRCLDASIFNLMTSLCVLTGDICEECNECCIVDVRLCDGCGECLGVVICQIDNDILCNECTDCIC